MLYMMPTIDVEAAHGQRPFDEMIEGKINHGKSWGVYRQAEIFQRFGVRAVFFIDVYEARLWGEKQLATLCQNLVSMGQDVQLHTHPGWRLDPRDSNDLQNLKRSLCFFPPNKDFMAKLTQNQQIDFLEVGVRYFEKWLGYKPCAHRSGGYSVNADTLEALRTVGIRIDSSMHPYSKNSEINWSLNRVVEKDGIVEFPVTVMKLQMLPGIKWAKMSRNMKTDIDSVSGSDLLEYIRKSLHGGIRIMNLFMHSYSLLNMNYGFKKLYPSERKERNLIKVLKYCANNPSITFIDSGSFLDLYHSRPDDFNGSDDVPVVCSPQTAIQLCKDQICRMAFMDRSK